MLVQGFSYLMFEISVNIDISVLGFYKYIINIGKILVDIFTQILVRWKLFKIDGNVWKSLKNDKINKNMLKLFYKCNWYKYGQVKKYQ